MPNVLFPPPIPDLRETHKSSINEIFGEMVMSQSQNWLRISFTDFKYLISFRGNPFYIPRKQ